ncbi:putative tubulin-specific chaperone E, partial [Apostichopus japonicus]
MSPFSCSNSENRLVIPSEPATLLPHFSSLQELLLNRVSISWEELLDCAVMWPLLKKLVVCFNHLSPLKREPKTCLQELELLNLEGNDISSWDEVLTVGRLPKLQTLILNANKLPDICFDDASPRERTRYFPQLKSISLNYNEITEWTSMSELNKLENLEELFFKCNPLTKEVPQSDVRGKLIAKLRKLKKFNNSMVLRGERRGAEIDYLKQNCKEWLESGGSRDANNSQPSEAFVTSHPTYEKLLEIYGAPEESETVVEAKDLKSTLIEVFITCPQDPSKKQLKKKAT